MFMGLGFVALRIVRVEKGISVCITYRYYELLLSPKSPVEVRPSTITGGGLGLFARDIHEEGDARSSSSTSTADYYRHDELVLSSVLWGVALDIENEVYETLVDSHYPSLLCGYRGKRFIIAGPLSLVNHACRSPLCFTNPRQTVYPELPEEFSGIPAIRLVARRDFSLDSGQEILADYFCTYTQLKRLPQGETQPTVFGQPCRCPTCDRGNVNKAET